MMRLRLVMPIMAAMIGFAVPAHADVDSNDQNFLAALNKAGITSSSPEQAVTAGKTVCQMMGDGTTNADLVKQLTQQNPGFSVDSAAKFAAIAASAYCPDRLNGGGSANAAP